ncbi:PAS domain S-box [Natrialba chahannaoensis JCM 10990]|uniref:PAS domain S-box n=1 Tax=Natrialba chahannaoensis JCM 10990 TaxID=1227492 RepID=M0A3T5_9EURY|nr:bacterio-opsin activator domain-containing protein [Natrialba chahannaoensis]ELY93264.1 PAS domain S-box [Natrialba chahannaoensis JCM 10990]
MKTASSHVDKRFLEEIATASSDGLIGFDAEGDIVFANRAAEEWLGYPDGALLDRSIDEFVAGEHAVTLDRLTQRARQADEATASCVLLDRRGRENPVSLTLRLATDDDQRRFIAVVHKQPTAGDEQVEHEQLLRQRSAAIEAANDGMAITDEDGIFVYSNDAHASLFGYDDAPTIVGRSWKQLFTDADVERFEAEVLPTVAEHGSWRGDATGYRKDGSTFPIELALSSLGDGIVCVVRDATEQIARQRQLESLTDGLRELLTADDPESVGRLTLEAVETVLEFEIACVRLFNPDTNRLDCTVLTDAAASLLETRAAYDLEATLAGQAFREGATVSNRLSSTETTETEEAGFGNDDVEEYSSLHVPIGTDGVLTILAETAEELDDRAVQLAEMLAVNARTAIGRAERIRLLEAHEQELCAQRDQLETHNQINTLIQEIGRRLIEASTREELEETICEQLVASELYHSAWIGEIETSTDRLTTQVGYGITDSDLEAINEMSIGSIGHGTVERMLESGSVEVVRSYELRGKGMERRVIVADSGAGTGVASESESESESVPEPDPNPNPDPNTNPNQTPDTAANILSTAAIPLTYGDRLLGVLVVNGTGDSIFGEETVTGFESLGRVTGFAINAIRNRLLLLADSVIELEFRITDPTLFSLAVATELDCECWFERSVPVEGGKILTYYTITGSDPASVLEVASGAPQVSDARVITERTSDRTGSSNEDRSSAVTENENGTGTEPTQQLVLQTASTNSLAHVALESGTTVRDVVASANEARVVIEAPQTADVRAIVSLFDAEFDGVELTAKRERDRSVETVAEFRQAVDTALTEKQRAALESAYAAGYYDWPRAITAEELAASMGISSSTLHQHLRKGIWSVLWAFLDGDDTHEN